MDQGTSRNTHPNTDTSDEEEITYDVKVEEKFYQSILAKKDDIERSTNTRITIHFGKDCVRIEGKKKDNVMVAKTRIRRISISAYKQLVERNAIVPYVANNAIKIFCPKNNCKFNEKRRYAQTTAKNSSNPSKTSN